MKVESSDWMGLKGFAQDILKELRRPAEEGVRDAARLFQRETQEQLTGQRSGRQYRVLQSGSMIPVAYGPQPKRKKGGGKLHTASSPGESPAVLTGRLRRSIAVDGPTWVGTWEVMADVGTNVEYARRLEYGGEDRLGRKMEARPYFAPAWLRSRDRVDAILQAAIDRYSGGAGGGA